MGSVNKRPFLPGYSFLTFLLYIHLLFFTVRALPSGFREEGVARIHGISTITFAPNREGGYFIYAAVKDGQVMVVPDPDISGNSWTALDISDRVCFNGERGIHQVLAHPRFPETSIVYISYTFDKHGGCGMSSETGAVNRLSRFSVREDYSIVDDSEEVLVETSPLPNKIHNGGDMVVGNDGNLYLTIGEGGRSRNSQDLGNLLGKIIRVTLDGDIPSDNPFQGDGTARCHQSDQPGKICQEIYHYGFRNPYRFSLDPNTDQSMTRLYVGDVGGTTWEEISVGGDGYAGGNYGWNIREGPCRSNSYVDCPDSGSEMVDPMFWYGHNGGGAAVTGIEVVPEGLWSRGYDGSILYLEFVQSKLFEIHADGTSCASCDAGRPLPIWTKTLFHGLQDSNVGRAAQLLFGPYQNTQALYYTTRSGALNIRRILYEGNDNQAPIAQISMKENIGRVGVPLVFDGSGSIDPDGDYLEYLWEFGDGATSASPSPTHAYSSAGTYNLILRVTDAGGFSAAAEESITIGAPPSVTIEAPSEGTTFAVGDIFTLVGSAVDDNGDILPDSSLSWEVRQHHNTHFHPFLDPTTGNGIVIDPAPSPEDFLAALDSHLEILLTATDDTGLSTSASLILMPQMAELSVESNPPGMELFIDDYSVVTPVSVASWVGHPLSARAVDQEGLYFQTWSDGGGMDHVMHVRSGVQTYSAHYAECKPLWRIQCTSNSDCCSGVCLSNICRMAPKYSKEKLSSEYGGAASGPGRGESRQLGRHPIRGA